MGERRREMVLACGGGSENGLVCCVWVVAGEREGAQVEAVHTSRGPCQIRQRVAESHCAGEHHELSIWAGRQVGQGGSSWMRIRVPIPQAGQSRRLWPVRAA